MTNEVLRVRDVVKTYCTPAGGDFVLNCESLTLDRGEMLVLRGHSGSGKSTLLHIFGLLMKPDSGALTVLGEDVSKLSAASGADFRRQHLGIVFQAFNLLPQLTAEQNVSLAYPGRAREARARALEVLDSVGLRDRSEHLPGALSGGEQQRVAFARAIVNEPSLLLADEPTGNLDTEAEQRVLGMFRDWAMAGRSVLLVSHSDEVAAHADRVVTMDSGRLTCEVA